MVKTKMSHTPGPWELHETRSIVGPKIDDKPVWLRPVVLRMETGISPADAALICAAPDLLAALEGLLTVLPSAHPAIDAARAAIKKARGE